MDIPVSQALTAELPNGHCATILLHPSKTGWPVNTFLDLASRLESDPSALTSLRLHLLRLLGMHSPLSCEAATNLAQMA